MQMTAISTLPVKSALLTSLPWVTRRHD